MNLPSAIFAPMSELEAWEARLDQLEACRECAAALASMLHEAHTMGCKGVDMAEAFKPLMDIIPLLKVR